MIITDKSLIISLIIIIEWVLTIMMEWLKKIFVMICSTLKLWPLLLNGRSAWGQCTNDRVAAIKKPPHPSWKPQPVPQSQGPCHHKMILQMFRAHPGQDLTPHCYMHTFNPRLCAQTDTYNFCNYGACKSCGTDQTPGSTRAPLFHLMAPGKPCATGPEMYL